MRKIYLLGILICFATGLSAQGPLRIDSISNLTYPNNVRLNDIWGYVDSAGTEYALVGKSNGLSVVSLADTTNLVEIFTEQVVYSIWRDIKTWGNYAYVTNESAGGIAIYDLSTLPDSVNSVTYFTGVNYAINSAHNIYIDENGVAYIFGSNHSTGSFGTVMLDVATTPGQPIELGYFDSLYLHDGYARRDTLYGSAVYAGELLVIDVKDKSNPTIVGSKSTPSNFTHNSWPSDDTKTIFTTDEVVGGYVAAYDVSNPNNIVQLDRIRSQNTLDVIPHNTHVLNDYLLTSYYTLGVSIIDANKPDNLIEVGFFDTSPSYTGGTFNGNWGAYPYFPSGRMILSDIEEGLFLVRPTYKRASYLEGSVKDCNGNALSQVEIDIDQSFHQEKTNLLGNYKSGSHLDGYFSVTVSKQGYISQTYDSIQLVSGQVTFKNFELYQIGDGLDLNVLDSSNNAVDSVLIVLKNQDTTLLSFSDANGVAKNYDIAFGNYVLSGGKWGFEPICDQLFDFSCASKNDSLVIKQGYSDNFNQDFNWLVTGSENQGSWTREIPIGSVNGVNVANPGADQQSDCGDYAFITGNGFGPADAFDVDSTTILTSPEMDLSNYADPYINFYSWFYNEGILGNDQMMISFIDANNNRIAVDTIYGGSLNVIWNLESYRVTDFISISNFRKLEVSVTDKAPSNIVEAGIDNFIVSEGVFVGIKENAREENTVRVYPNPFKDQLIVGFKDESYLGSVLQVYDINSKLVFTENVNSQRHILNTNELKSGIYFVRLISRSGEVFTEKIIKH